VNVSQALDDIKAFLENDPLVQAAVGSALAAPIRQVLADLTRSLETEVGSVTAAAAQQAADAARADVTAQYAQPPEIPQ
jgi:hypothetical protein